MPMPKYREPLVKRAVSITERQAGALEEMAKEEQRSVSHFVREAIDGYLDLPDITPLVDAPEPQKQAVA